MIKTLRITSVVAAVLAGVFIVFHVIYGVSDDGRVDKFLKLPGVREKFESAADTKMKTGQSQESPLVKQAEAFALYLNPLKPAVRKVIKGAKTPIIDSKINVTPKFTVLATIVYPDDPTLSQVLINEPGKGRFWIRQSSTVNHLFVEEVKDGLVVLKSGQETYNLEISEEAAAASTGKPSTASSYKRSPVKPKPTAYNRAAPVSRTRNIPKRTQNSSDEKRVDEFVDKLKELQKHSVTNDADSQLDPQEEEQRKARIQELISKFKSSRVSAEESKKLDDMGEELKGNEEDPNSSEDKADKSEGKVSPSKPAVPAKK